MPVTRRSPRAGDEQDLVLLGEARHLHGDPGRDRPGDDRHALADEVDRGRDGLVGLAAVVDDLELDRAAVDRAGAVGGVVEPGLEAVEVGLAVGAEEPGRRGDDPDADRLAVRGRRVAIVGVRVRVVVRVGVGRRVVRGDGVVVPTVAAGRQQQGHGPRAWR
jgi:hypothetical protein